MKRRNKNKRKYVSEMEQKIPRKIRRNQVRKIIKNDGLNKVNTKLAFYWKDVQNGAYKI